MNASLPHIPFYETTRRGKLSGPATVEATTTCTRARCDCKKRHRLKWKCQGRVSVSLTDKQCLSFRGNPFPNNQFQPLEATVAKPQVVEHCPDKLHSRGHLGVSGPKQRLVRKKVTGDLCILERTHWHNVELDATQLKAEVRRILQQVGKRSWYGCIISKQTFIIYYLYYPLLCCLLRMYSV